MAAYAIIQTGTNLVVNVVEWDGVADWTAPDGTYIALAGDTGAIGMTYNSETQEYS